MILFLIGKISDGGVGNGIFFSGQLAALLKADGVVLNIAGQVVDDDDGFVVALAGVALGQLCVQNCEVSSAGVDLEQAVGLLQEALNGDTFEGGGVGLAREPLSTAASLPLRSAAEVMPESALAMIT